MAECSLSIGRTFTRPDAHPSLFALLTPELLSLPRRWFSALYRFKRQVTLPSPQWNILPGLHLHMMQLRTLSFPDTISIRESLTLSLNAKTASESAIPTMRGKMPLPGLQNINVPAGCKTATSISSVMPLTYLKCLCSNRTCRP